MVTRRTAHTSDLPQSLARELRTLLDATFEGDFSDDDWDHARGGVHVWLADSGRVVSHASLTARTLDRGGPTLTVGFVEAVATAAVQRRLGHRSRVMRQIAALVEQHYPLGVPSTGAFAFYETLGWDRWRGPTFVDGPAGQTRTPDDDGDIMVLRTARSPRLDLTAASSAVGARAMRGDNKRPGSDGSQVCTQRQSHALTRCAHLVTKGRRRGRPMRLTFLRIAVSSEYSVDFRWHRLCLKRDSRRIVT